VCSSVGSALLTSWGISNIWISQETPREIRLNTREKKLNREQQQQQQGRAEQHSPWLLCANGFLKLKSADSVSIADARKFIIITFLIEIYGLVSVQCAAERRKLKRKAKSLLSKKRE
jgi:hypothetical protein